MDQIQKITPQIIRDAMEGVYETPIKLLGSFGQKKLAQLQRKLPKIGVK